MNKVLLDTNFILSCIREKVDIFDKMECLGYVVMIPTIVIDELKRISLGNKSSKLRSEAEFALRVLKSEKYEEVKAVGRYADIGIINYLKKNPSIAVATLDREIKKSVKNPKIVLRARQRLEVI